MSTGPCTATLARSTTRSTTTRPPVPVLNPADVEITTDQAGRVVAIVPDPVARGLAGASRDSWRETPGDAYGHSRDYPPGTPEHAAALTILAAVITADPPAPPNASGPTDAVLAARGSFYGAVTGRSAWTTTTRWWALPVTSPEHRALTCSASLHLPHRDRSVHWAG